MQASAMHCIRLDILINTSFACWRLGVLCSNKCCKIFFIFILLTVSLWNCQGVKILSDETRTPCTSRRFYVCKAMILLSSLAVTSNSVGSSHLLLSAMVSPTSIVSGKSSNNGLDFDMVYTRVATMKYGIKILQRAARILLRLPWGDQEHTPKQ